MFIADTNVLLANINRW